MFRSRISAPQAAVMPLAAAAALGGAATVLVAAGPATAAQSAAAWSATSTLGPALHRGSRGGQDQMATDADGNAVALWTAPSADPRPNSRQLLVAERPAGGAWSTPRVVADPISIGSNPSLSVSSDGWASVTWLDASNWSQGRFAVRSPSGEWSAPADIGPTTGSDGRPFGPQAPTMTAGEHGLLTARFIADLRWVGSQQITVWGSAVRLPGAAEFSTPQVDGPYAGPWIEPDGTAVVAQSTDGISLLTRTGSSMTFGTRTPVLDASAGAGFTASDLIFLPDGTALLGLTRDDAGTASAYTIRRDADGHWGTPVRIGSGRLESLVPSGASVVARLADTDILQGTTTTRTARLGTDGTWETPQAVVTSTADHQVSDLQLAVNPAGTEVASWDTPDGPSIATRRAGAAWTELPVPAGAAGGDATGVALDANDQATFTWYAGEQLQSATTSLRPAASAAGVVRIRTGLGTFFAPCPASVAVTLNGRPAGSLPTTGAGTRRCAVSGTVTAPTDLRPGSWVFVTVTGRGIWPAFGLTRVGTAQAPETPAAN